MDLTKMSLNDLKAAAYDQLATAENAQRALGVINQEISKRLNSLEAGEKKKDEKGS